MHSTIGRVPMGAWPTSDWGRGQGLTKPRKGCSLSVRPSRPRKPTYSDKWIL